MRGNFLNGLIAGAAGTTALNAATYLDMAVRGRPSSSVPSQLAGKFTALIGLDLASNGEQQSAGQNRLSGIGALLGYATGLGVGAAYGLLRSTDTAPPLPLAGTGIGLTAMAASDIPATAFGVTDPRTWGVTGWLSDIVPHLVYGLVTAAVFERLSR